MEEVLHNFEDIGIYLDIIGAFFMTWEHHIVPLHKMLHQLEVDDFKVNLLKQEWVIKEIDWLGYLLMPKGLKSWHIKLMES